MEPSVQNSEPELEAAQCKDVIKQDIGNNRFGKPKMPLIKYKWSETYEAEARDAIARDSAQKGEDAYADSEKRTQAVWNKFYKHHQNKYFHPRNYLHRELPELQQTQDALRRDNKFLFTELGCGVGDTIFPLVSQYANVVFQGCDLSSEAIKCIQSHKEYDGTRFRAAVCDLVHDPLPADFESTHIATLIFCLSAIAPENHALVARKVFEFVRPGGVFYFRDYGRYDHQQVNLARKGGRKLKENFYEKGDGIRVYYFEEGEVARLFESAGFEVLECRTFLRYMENRKRGIEMYRVWIQGRFRKPGDKVFDDVTVNRDEDEQRDQENEEDGEQEDAPQPRSAPLQEVRAEKVRAKEEQFVQQVENQLQDALGNAPEQEEKKADE